MIGIPIISSQHRWPLKSSRTNMPLVIGIVGAKGSGKGTFAATLEAVAPVGVHVARVRMSDVLRETLDLWHLPQSRANLQHFSGVMDAEFGSGTLAHAIGHRIASAAADIVVVDGVRWEADRLLIRSFPQNILIAVTADVRVRYERLTQRGENAQESHTTFEQFLEEEQAVSERAIPAIVATADVRITNEGALDAYVEQIRRCCSERIQPLLAQCACVA